MEGAWDYLRGLSEAQQDYVETKRRLDPYLRSDLQLMDDFFDELGDEHNRDYLRELSRAQQKYVEREKRMNPGERSSLQQARDFFSLMLRGIEKEKGGGR